MDPFKLLSASTKVRTINNDSKAGVVPAQDPGHVDRVASTVSASRKRKRSSNGDLKSLDGKSQSSQTPPDDGSIVIDRSSALSLTDAVAEGPELVDDVTRDGESTESATASKNVLQEHKIRLRRIWESPRETAFSSTTTKSKPKKLSKRNEDVTVRPVVHLRHLQDGHGVSHRIARNLVDQGYDKATEVQMASLPLLLGSSTFERHSSHMLSIAPTGSGKTLAFLIPLIQAITEQLHGKSVNSERQRPKRRADGPSSVILAPTKELAKQISNEGRKLAKSTGLRIVFVRKGMRILSTQGPVHEDSNAEKDGSPTSGPFVNADILVSTPQALLNAIGTMPGTMTTLPSVKYLTLDEADVLLDPLFRDETMSVWTACSAPSLHVSLWSATMGSNIEDITKTKLQQRWQAHPTTGASLVSEQSLVRLVVGLKDSAIPNIEHELVYAGTEQGKLASLRQLLRAPARLQSNGLSKLHPPFLIFTQTIPRAIALHSELLYDVPQEAGGSSRIAVLHADLSDPVRDQVMTKFRKGEIWVLITTDLLSRGVDFRGINGVINYDLPNSSAAYVHRVGRTGRAGRAGGVAVTLYSNDDIPHLKNVANVIAAAERQKNREGRHDRQWLLDSLPTPTKQDKKDLKQRGVDSRRKGKARDENGRLVNAKDQISTKSGFERRVNNQRKDAIESNRRKKLQRERREADSADEDFEGFEDT